MFATASYAWLVTIVAQVDPNRDARANPPEAIRGTDLDATELVLAYGALAVALVVLALIVWWVTRWFRQQTQDYRPTPSELLSEFRAMREDDEEGLTEEEFAKVRARLSNQARARVRESEQLAPPPANETSADDSTAAPAGGAGDPPADVPPQSTGPEDQTERND